MGLDNYCFSLDGRSTKYDIAVHGDSNFSSQGDICGGKMLKKFVSQVALLLLSATVTNAADCANDASLCSPKQLCEVTTTSIDGKLVWRKNGTLSEHLNLVKKYDVNCGDVTTACEQAPAECSLTELCDIATLQNNGSIEWNVDALDHIAYAKQYSLSCKVGQSQNTYPDSAETLGGSIGFTKSDFAMLTLVQRKQVQFALKKLGLYNSSVDGLWGRNTSSAIDTFVLTRSIDNDVPRTLYTTLRNEGLFKDFSSAFETKPKPTAARRGKNGSLTCKLLDNEYFERLWAVEDFKPRTDDALNAIRSFEVIGDKIKMGYSDLKKRENGTWKRAFHVQCEDNGNGWSPCGSIYGNVTVRKVERSYKATLLIPWQWGRGLLPHMKLDYSCSK
jgi:hypothetical protein